MFNPKRILILAPHTDDGELGCGGSIAKFINEGKEVHYIAFSDCKKSLPNGFAEDSLQKECKAALTSLGVAISNIHILDFDVRNFSQHRQAILDALIKFGKEIQPDLVFIPSTSDIHQDHQVVHHEALRAFKSCSILGYELPWNQQIITTNFFVSLSQKNIEQKATALALYHSQEQKKYMKKDFSFSLAKIRGTQANVEWAEAFEMLRIIT